jgi:hypothetical protein
LSDGQALGLMIAAGALSGISFLFAGLPAFGDVWPHLVRIQVTYEAFRSGHLPGWSFFFYGGYPLLRFYSPLFYYLAAPFCFLTGGNPFVASKIVLFLLHVASGIVLYYLARHLLEDPIAALVAGFCYLFGYWHLLYVIGMGRYPVALVFVVLPLGLWLFDRLLEKPDLPRAILAGLAIAALPLTHVFFAYVGIPFLLVWFLLRISSPLTGSGTPPVFGAKTGSVPILSSVLAAVIGVLLSAVFTLPFLIEGPQRRMPEPALNLPPPSVWVLSGLSSEMSGYSGSYMGLGILILAVCGVLLLRRKRRLLGNPSFWCLLVSLGFAFSSYLPFMSRLPLISELASERFLVFTLVFVCVLAGFGYQYLEEKLGFRRLWLPVLAVLFLDATPRVFNNVYRSPDEFLESRQYVYRKLAGRTDGRLLDTPVEGKDPQRRFIRYPAQSYLLAGTPAVLGPPYHQFAPRSMLYAYAWTEDIAREFLDSTSDKLPERTLRELRLLDVKYVVTLPTHKTSGQGVTYVFLKKGLTWNDTLIRQMAADQERISKENPDSMLTRQPLAIGTFEEVSPVVIAPEVAPVRSLGDATSFRPENWWCPHSLDSLEQLHTYYIAPDWESLPEEMGLDPGTGVAQRILIRADRAPSGLTTKTPRHQEPGTNNQLNSVGTLPVFAPKTGGVPILSEDSVPLQFQVGRLQQEHERVELNLIVSSDCYARLAYSYYPELQVLDNGTPTQVWETADHFLLIRLTRGSHALIITPTLTRIRVISRLISAIALVLCLTGFILSKAVRPRARSHLREHAPMLSPM